MKKKFLVALSMLLVVGLATGCGCSKKTETKKEEQEKYNTNEEVVKDQEVGELKFTNTSLKVDDNYSTLVTLVSNPTSSDVEVRIFYIHVKDKDGNEIVKLEGYVGDVIPAGESREIISNADMDLSKAASIEYEMVK